MQLRLTLREARWQNNAPSKMHYLYAVAVVSGLLNHSSNACSSFEDYLTMYVLRTYGSTSVFRRANLGDPPQSPFLAIHLQYRTDSILGGHTAPAHLAKLVA